MNKKPNGYWTKEKCQKEALKYKTKSEFYKNSSSAYVISCRNKWISDICSHMKLLGNKYKRCIYAYEFPDNHVYIGLTYNLEKRHNDRLNRNRDSVKQHIDKTNLQPILKQLTDYISIEKSVEMEAHYVNYYKNNNWNILNKIKTGALGSNFKRSKEECKKEASKYITKKDFMLNSNAIYQSAYKNGWIDDICSHMIKLIKKPKRKWTYEKCQEEALKYKTKSEFYKNSSSAYSLSYRYGWLNEICSHMERPKPKRKWTYEKCQEEALKYKTKSEFYKNSKGCYNASWKYNWLEDICSHMNK